MRMFSGVRNPSTSARGAVVAVAAAGVVTGLAPLSPAHAVINAVNISPVPAVTVPYGGSTLLTPRVGVAGNVVLVNKTLTVKNATSTLAYNQPSVRVRAGTYAVTTIARYKTYTTSTSTRMEQQTRLVASNGDAVDAPTTCTITRVSLPALYGDPLAELSCTSDAWDGVAKDAMSLRTYDAGTTWTVLGPDGPVDFTPPAPDPTAQSAVGFSWTQSSFYVTYLAGDLYKTSTVPVTTTTRVYSALKAKVYTQTLVIRSQPKPRGCAYYSEFLSVRANWNDARTYGSSKAQVATLLQSAGTQSSFSNHDGQILEFRHYRGCTGATISVGFENGYAYTKSYWG